MIPLTIAEIAEIIGAEIVGIDPTEIITEVPVIDSRKVEVGSFFVALPGERVDGNSFAKEAIENGARFAITTINLGIPSLVVEDAGVALTTLATVVRERIKHCTFIGITGSHGKTTTKD